MAINFRIRKAKNDASIYVRFKTKNIDLEQRSGLIINAKYWDKEKQRIRNVIDVPNRVELNDTLSKLQLYISDEYNKDFIQGELINKFWLNNKIETFFNRPKTNESGAVDLTKIYLSDYIDFWLKNKAKTHKVSSKKYIDEKTIGQYKQVLKNLIDFEGKNKVKFVDLSNEKLDDISLYLTDEKKYSYITAKRKINRLKFFCARAESENIPINKQYKEQTFIKEEEVDYKQPYFNETEINNIFKYDFSFDKTLEDCRDNLIIGLWTGLRVSDFLTRLNTDNIEGGFIRIKTLKTNTWVTIPIHKQVEFILNKRNGNLPNKISEQKFNQKIKIIAQVCDIDEEMIGGVPKVDPKTKIKRKVVGLYKKYELVTSHICRRSFCTNLFGKVPNSIIMSVAGWASEDMLLKYNKQTNMESALILKDFWNKQN